MKRTKIATLLFAAIIAVAFTAPVAASATVWTHNSEPLATDDVIETVGSFGLHLGSGSFSCESEIVAELSANSDEGEILGFSLHNCSTNGSFAYCSIEDLYENGNLAPLRATESGDIEIPDFAFAIEITDVSPKGDECGPWGIFEGTWEFEDVEGFTLSPDNSEAMSVWAGAGGSLNTLGPANVVTPYGNPMLEGLNAYMDIFPAGEYGIE